MVIQPRLRKVFSRFDVLSFGAGLIEKIITNWTSIASYGGGGVLMGWLAYLQDVRPLWWGIAFFAGLLFVTIIRALARWGRSKEAQARLFDATAVTPGAFNRLQTEYIRQMIRVADLIHPLGEPLTGKVFVECEFFGPGLIATSGCGFGGFTGGNIEFIKLRADRVLWLPNKAIVVNSHFRQCKFYNVALAMTTESADELNKRLGGKIPVLGE